MTFIRAAHVFEGRHRRIQERGISNQSAAEAPEFGVLPEQLVLHIASSASQSVLP